MYAKVEDVRSSIQTSAINTIIKNELIKDPAEQELKVVEIIERAIVDASSEIDGYLNKRYSTPLGNVPNVITKICKDIALYNIFLRIGIKQGSAEESYYNQYKQDIKYLENVAKGLIDIGVATGEQSGTSSNIGDFRVNSNKRMFSRQTLRGL